MRAQIYNFAKDEPLVQVSGIMESISKQITPLELSLQDVQSYIYKMTNGPMKDAQFQFSRSGFSYKRKNKKSNDELSFIFLNRFPVNYRLSFQLEIWHPQIKQIKQSFMGKILQKASNLCSIILYLKDFPAHDSQQERVKDYSICDHRDLFMAGDWIAQILQYDLVPLCNQMNTISNMDRFFESNPEWSLDTHSGGNICTDLIVAQLNRQRDVHRRFDQLMNGIQQRIENHQINPESRNLLTLCYESIR